MDENANLNSKNEDGAAAPEVVDEPHVDVDSNNDSLTIEKKLRVQDFNLLHERFNRAVVDVSDEFNDTLAGSLNKQEFVDSFESLLDLHQYGNQLEKLFDKLNSKETGLINWNDFCTYMLQFYQEEDYANALRTSPFNSEPKIRHVPHNKLELTAKVLHIENPVKFINISKEGYLGLWTTNLNLEKTYSAAEELDEGTNNNTGGGGQTRRKAGMWITDAVYMPDAHKLVLASTSRDLRFFTISTEIFLEEFVIFGVKDVPTCLDYYPSRSNENTESTLIFGDDCGSIHILYFKRPTTYLFDPARKKTDSSKSDKSATNNIQRIFWDELKDHDKFVRYHSMGAIHQEYVRKILYVPHNNSIIASSGDSRNSLVIITINKIKKPYVFRSYKGCECFDYSRDLNILITGGADYLARIWNPYVTQKNTAILEGHHAAVIDVRINERVAQCYTFSKDAVIKAWDLKELFCLQTIPVRFPSTLGGKTPSFGLFPMDLYLNRSSFQDTSLPGGLVLACNDYLCLMKLGQDTSKDQNLVETHTAPISCAVYNPKLKHLITCADNSSIGAWDIESGRKAYLVLDAHDGEEITCIAIDRQCRKLATGARNGVVKIWNSANGQSLHVLPSVEDAEITGIVFADKGIITVGWSRKIVKYAHFISDERNDDQTETVELVIPKADLTWRGLQIHRDDILCLEHLLPVNNLMCTASYDGEINVWSIDTEKLIMCLRKAPKAEPRREPSNYRRSASHRSIIRGPTPVDKLLFLKHRAKENMRLGTLISSEAGNLHWWSLYNERKDMGIFYGASKPGESILAMCSDATNRYLMCGDTLGEMRVWNIEDYCCTIASFVSYETKSPPLLYSWQAHETPIIFCEWTDYKGQGDFILTASTDRTACLWTLNGEKIGIFGQKQLWDIETIVLTRIPNEDEQNREENINNNENISNEVKSTTTTNKTNLLLPEITVSNDEKNERSLPPLANQNSKVTKTPEISESASQNSTLPARTSGLGLSVERGLNQQKLKRQERRHRFSDIDARHLAKGGVCFTPFALLSTQDIDEASANASIQHKAISFDELFADSKEELPSKSIAPTKSRLVLPSITTRQRTPT
ncbi:unnamed protein product [Adineta steineri]|uniref:EF-hand domain-containing protein n=1 Tax=Adineta steineri TaxID=433720 RepID=A0A815CFZ1_9BILA|nr:unnamed protein product [Adineta steineri]